MIRKNWPEIKAIAPIKLDGEDALCFTQGDKGHIREY